MKKKVIYAVLIGMMCFAFAGCDSNSDAGSKEDENKKTESSKAADDSSKEEDGVKTAGEDALQIINDNAANQDTALAQNQTPFFGNYRSNMHECNHDSWAEYMTYGMMGNIKDVRELNISTVFITDTGLWCFSSDKGEDVKEACNQQHGLVHISDRTDLECFAATSNSDVIVKTTGGEYYVYYAGDKFAHFTFSSADKDSIEEIKIAWPSDCKEVFDIACSFGGYTFFDYLTTDGEIRECHPGNYDKYGAYEVSDGIYQPDPYYSRDGGYGLQTYFDKSAEQSGENTRVDYNIEKVAVVNGGFNQAQKYFLADQTIYSFAGTGMNATIDDLRVRSYQPTDGDAAFSGTKYISLDTIYNVEKLYDSHLSGNQFEYKKIGDNQNLYIAKTYGSENDSIFAFDLSTINHTTDDIVNIYNSGDRFFIEFSNKEFYCFKGFYSKPDYEANRLADLTKMNEAGNIKIITQNDSGELTVVGYDNYVYQFSR